MVGGDNNRSAISLMNEYLTVIYPEESIRFQKLTNLDKLSYIEENWRRLFPFLDDVPDYYRLLIDKFKNIDFFKLSLLLNPDKNRWL